MRHWLLIVGYFIARYALFETFDSVFRYASYLFEACFVAGAAYLYRESFTWKFDPKPAFWKQAGAAFGLGFLICFAAGRTGIGMPFALDRGEAVFFLLAGSPILEELLFRMALFLPLAGILARRNTSVLIAANAAMFAAVHWVSVFQVDAAVKPFVALQSVYALALGGLCAAWMVRTLSVSYPIVLHFLFNLGFYFGSF
ncbi:MAG: CPBP family intramembrane metalloprotease [Bdellovibrionales bacterium]|nr:CPBP family intramembrane metalloprotease [Bdellovibrionales bacterium]